jgi:hypothetical protein
MVFLGSLLLLNAYSVDVIPFVRLVSICVLSSLAIIKLVLILLNVDCISSGDTSCHLNPCKKFCAVSVISGCAIPSFLATSWHLC